MNKNEIPKLWKAEAWVIRTLFNNSGQLEDGRGMGKVVANIVTDFPKSATELAINAFDGSITALIALTGLIVNGAVGYAEFSHMINSKVQFMLDEGHSLMNISHGEYDSARISIYDRFLKVVSVVHHFSNLDEGTMRKLGRLWCRVQFRRALFHYEPEMAWRMAAFWAEKDQAIETELEQEYVLRKKRLRGDAIRNGMLAAKKRNKK